MKSAHNTLEYTRAAVQVREQRPCRHPHTNTAVLNQHAHRISRNTIVQFQFKSSQTSIGKSVKKQTGNKNTHFVIGLHDNNQIIKGYNLNISNNTQVQYYKSKQGKPGRQPICIRKFDGLLSLTHAGN